jgi:hypothetical protein
VYVKRLRRGTGSWDPPLEVVAVFIYLIRGMPASLLSRLGADGYALCMGEDGLDHETDTYVSLCGMGYTDVMMCNLPRQPRIRNEKVLVPHVDRLERGRARRILASLQRHAYVRWHFESIINWCASSLRRRVWSLSLLGAGVN